MSDRIIATDCPHCGKYTECFVMLGQTFIDTCQECKKTIYFDESGNSYKKMSKKKLDAMVKERDNYYNNLSKQYRNARSETFNSGKK